MAHATLHFSRTAIDRAGRVLLDDKATAEQVDAAWDTLANWRSVHDFPLNTATMDLRQKVRHVDSDALVVQRLKRARSILTKLVREPSMRLTQMQDIGGCRAVVSTVRDVYALRDRYLNSRFLHKYVGCDDYIANPKDSGYRSFHLIYKYQSRKHPKYNGLMFEVQLRTVTQNAWATAVETVGAVLGQALKASEGEQVWLSYFQNAALALEYTENDVLAVQRATSRGVLARELLRLGKELGVSKKLAAYRAALKATEGKRIKVAAYYLLVLLPDQKQLQIKSYTRRQSDIAFRDYEQFERRLPLHPPGSQLPLFPELSDYSGAQAVLVRADSLRSLREAYPNYYLDTEVFLEKVNRFTRRYRRSA